MKIVKNENGMFGVVNMFGQMIDFFEDYDSAFDCLYEMEN